MVRSHKDGSQFALTGGEALNEVLKKLAKKGWKPEGELPPFSTTGEYTIPIIKSDLV
jgi:hypothetical protein